MSEDEEPEPGQFPHEPGHVDTERYAEPEEFDPHDLGPPVPEAPDPTEEDIDVDPRLWRLFWGLVAVFNVALLALSLGVMIAVFDGKWVLGGQLVAVGLVFLIYGIYKYLTRDPERYRSEGEEATEESPPSAPEDGEADTD